MENKSAENKQLDVHQQKSTDVICGQCGDKMIMREITPCLDCGGLQGDMAEFKNAKRTYFKVSILDNEIVCDFCLADISHYDPQYYGFAEGFNWTGSLKNSVVTPTLEAEIKTELACSNPRCENTFRRQTFIKKNAARNKVSLPQAFWAYI